MKSLLKSKIPSAVGLLILVFLVGILGFRILFNYEWIDAMYMTVITITTVGYGELHPMDHSEKIFTSLLILTSVIIVAHAIKIISEYILSKNNIGNLRQRKMTKKIKALEDHVIVCGYGRNGKQAVKKLAAYNKSFVIIEKSEELIEDAKEEELLFVQGNAIEDKILQKAGIERAHSLICALPSDADNLFIVLSARQMNSDLKIVSRASEEASYKKLMLAGADHVIMPDRIGGDHMASLLVVPDLIEFLDSLAVSGEEASMIVEQIEFENICEGKSECALIDMDLRKNTGCSVIGYKTPEGEYIVNPEPSLMMTKGSKLILIGTPKQIERLKDFYKV